MMRLVAILLAGLVAAGFDASPGDIAGWRFVRSLPIGARADAVTTVVVPGPVRNGDTALGFELRPGDCSAGKHGWDDCARDRERVELKQTGYQHAGETWWYRLSFLMPADFPDIWPAKLAITQFHQEGAKPVIMLQHRKGGLWLDIHDARRTVRLVELIPPADLRGRWHDLRFAIDWRRDQTGRVRVWVDGAARADYRGPTMTARKVYFKFGLYRSHLARNRTGANVVQTIYFDDVMRARTERGLGPGVK